MAVCLRGETLAAADDGGMVTLHALGGAAPPAARALRRGHTSLAAAVCWRRGRTGELLSCGLDQRVVAWDAPNGRTRRSWDTGAVLGALAPGEGTREGPQTPLCNPPLAHCVASGAKDASGGARLAAVACGDGHCLLLALDAPKEAAQAWALGRAEGGHRAGVAHCCFPRYAAGRSLLQSGGNDGRLLLWDWAAAVAGTGPPVVLAAAAHGAKVNWAAAGAAEGPPWAYVADVSPRLAVYAVRP